MRSPITKTVLQFLSQCVMTKAGHSYSSLTWFLLPHILAHERYMVWTSTTAAAYQVCSQFHKICHVTANSSGVLLYVSTPLLYKGLPALGSTERGLWQYSANRMNTGSMPFGSKVQFMPTTSTSKSFIKVAKISTDVPVTLIPSASKVMWAMSGISVDTLRMANMAAFSSFKSDMVSTMMPSTPASMSSAACSRNTCMLLQIQVAQRPYNMPVEDISPSTNCRELRGGQSSQRSHLFFLCALPTPWIAVLGG